MGEFLVDSAVIRGFRVGMYLFSLLGHNLCILAGCRRLVILLGHYSCIPSGCHKLVVLMGLYHVYVLLIMNAVQCSCCCHKGGATAF